MSQRSAVASVPLRQLSMGADIGAAIAIQVNDPVNALQGGITMGNHNRGAAAAHKGQSLL